MIDGLNVVLCPSWNILSIWRRHHPQQRAVSLSRDYDNWVGRNPYGATPAVSRDLEICGFGQKSCTFWYADIYRNLYMPILKVTKKKYFTFSWNEILFCKILIIYVDWTCRPSGNVRTNYFSIFIIRTNYSYRL